MSIEKEVARGISREKTKESLAVIATLLAGLFAWFIGSATAGWFGAAILVSAMVFIYRWYRK